ncbi:MAG: SDR family oxidoreductase [Clostridia bacterium]|nr:SDR family oxidoreductase [Clostridia bacterium]
MLEKLDLTGKRGLITGAGSGIGRAIALRLAEEGMKLALVGRSADKLVRTAALTGRPLDMLVLPVDLTQPRGIDDIMRILEGHFKGLDVLVNNAGMALNRPFEETSEEDYDRIMNLNARVPFVLCRRTLKLLRQSECPTIINIGSVVAHDGYARQAAYAASKHALLGMTKALAKEVYGEGIRVHMISPGGVYTDMIAIARPDLSPEGMIQPEEVAELAAYLATHRGGAVIDEIRLHRAAKEPFI